MIRSVRIALGRTWDLILGFGWRKELRQNYQGQSSRSLWIHYQLQRSFIANYNL